MTSPAWLEWRCSSCNRLLMRYSRQDGAHCEIKCRCGTVASITVEGERPRDLTPRGYEKRSAVGY